MADNGYLMSNEKIMINFTDLQQLKYLSAAMLLLSAVIQKHINPQNTSHSSINIYPCNLKVPIQEWLKSP